jgi:hypothetical protein
MKKRIAAVLAVLALASMSFGQLKEGSIGISPGITFGPVINAPVIGLAYAITNDIRLDAGIGLNTVSDHYTNFALSLGGSYYLWKVDDIETFVSAGLGFSSISYSGSTTSDESHFGLSGRFGGEYNFSPRFSINGTIGLQIAFGSGHTLFGTTTGTALTWWIK